MALSLYPRYVLMVSKINKSQKLRVACCMPLLTKDLYIINNDKIRLTQIHLLCLCHNRNGKLLVSLKISENNVFC